MSSHAIRPDIALSVLSNTFIRPMEHWRSSAVAEHAERTFALGT